MICITKKKLKPKPPVQAGERGTILLETIIALPLFMVLIGGIMWSGQLIYEKQKLVVADRYVAWNFGNRFAQNYNDVQSKFFDESTSDSVNPPDTKDVSGSSTWWHEVHGAATVNAQMPVWTQGWFYANGAENGSSVPTSVALNGRELSDGTTGGHTVFMQKQSTPSDTRNEQVNHDSQQLNIDYSSINSEQWPAK